MHPARDLKDYCCDFSLSFLPLLGFKFPEANGLRQFSLDALFTILQLQQHQNK